MTWTGIRTKFTPRQTEICLSVPEPHLHPSHPSCHSCSISGLSPVICFDSGGVLGQMSDSCWTGMQIVAGVIGTLQPRFHVHGPIMLSAQKLEETCIPGTINVSGPIASLLKIEPGSEALVGYKLESPLLSHLYPEISDVQQILADDSFRRKRKGLVTVSESLALVSGVISCGDMRRRRIADLKSSELREIVRTIFNTHP